jgi:hypothetical protein
MGLKGQERRLSFEPMLTAQEVAATSSVHPAMARRWRVRRNRPGVLRDRTVAPLSGLATRALVAGVVPA